MMEAYPDEFYQVFDRVGAPGALMTPQNLMKLYVNKGDELIAAIVDIVPEQPLLPLCGDMQFVWGQEGNMIITPDILGADGERMPARRSQGKIRRNAKGLGLKNLFKRSIDSTQDPGTADEIERQSGASKLFSTIVGAAATIGAARGALKGAEAGTFQDTRNATRPQTVQVMGKAVNKYVLYGIVTLVILAIGIVVYKKMK